MGLGSDQPIPFIISWFVGVVFDLTDHEFSNYRLTIDDIASGWEQNYGQISDRAQGNTYTNFLGYFIFLLILYFSKIKIMPNQFDSIKGASTNHVDRFWDFFDSSLPLHRQFYYIGLFSKVDIW